MQRHLTVRPLLLVACVAVCATACATAPSMRLQRVVLYQNGIAYFERTGRAAPDGVALRLAPHEVDDVLTTLTVLDPDRPEDAPTPTAVIPTVSDEAQDVQIGLGGVERAVTLAYSAPTSAWRASYRLVLPDERGSSDAFLQAWAVVDNTTAEDWSAVELTLATDAPLSFAVDLRTPRTVDRPNVTGHHVPPIAFGPVHSELSTRSLDRDGDGILDEVDMCPEDGEDTDAFADADGCPEPDNDHDRIADVDDRCPTEPETYNGMEDEDGCPDMGVVVITDNSMVIMERIYFTADSSTIPERAAAILDATAAALRGNPEITVEVEGHADSAEDRPWLISTERAATVRAALIQRGIGAERLVARGYAQSLPVVAGSDERNRRVGFQIQEAPPTPQPAPTGGVRRGTVAASAPRGGPLPQTGSGGTRFPVSREVSVPAGQSAMLTILHRPVSGEDVLLYRVDPNVPTSGLHPFRAARFENRSGIDLVAGPVSLFASGELVGQGLLDPLRVGENAFIPYAIDSSTRLESRVDERDEPSRVVSLSEGRLVLERTRIRQTHYAIEPGHRAPGRIFVRHDRAVDYEPYDLPPETETRPGALLVPLHIAPARDTTLVVEERRAVRISIDLRSDLSTSLAPYLEATEIDPADRARLDALLVERTALATVREEANLLQRQLAETATRTAELRRSVEVLDERAGRSGASVRRRMSERLEAATHHAEELSARLATLRAREVEARARLREAARGLHIPAR